MLHAVGWNREHEENEDAKATQLSKAIEEPADVSCFLQLDRDRIKVQLHLEKVGSKVNV